MDKMRAIVATGPNEYGVQLVDIPKPGRNEVLCRIKSVAICGSDPKLFEGADFKLGRPPRYPFIFGHEWAGEVAKLGPNTTGFEVGDRVAGESHCGCGICENCKSGKYTLCLNFGNEEAGHHHYGFQSPGAYAEYCVYSVKSITKMPASVTFNEGCMNDTAGVAIHFVRTYGVTFGGYSAIYGDGPIGNICMQVAKIAGSNTIMVGSGERLKAAKRLGTDYIINFKEEDPVARIMDITGGKGAHEVLECAGTQESFYSAAKSVRKNGKLIVLSLLKKAEVVVPMGEIFKKQITICGSRANPSCSQVVMMLMERGEINVKELVTHTFPMEDIRKALDTFVNQKDGAIKVVINP
jgi:L-iditol 2-dehydrogenase